MEDLETLGLKPAEYPPPGLELLIGDLKSWDLRPAEYPLMSYVGGYCLVVSSGICHPHWQNVRLVDQVSEGWI